MIVSLLQSDFGNKGNARYDVYKTILSLFTLNIVLFFLYIKDDTKLYLNLINKTYEENNLFSVVYFADNLNTLDIQ